MPQYSHTINSQPCSIRRFGNSRADCGNASVVSGVRLGYVSQGVVCFFCTRYQLTTKQTRNIEYKKACNVCTTHGSSKRPLISWSRTSYSAARQSHVAANLPRYGYRMNDELGTIVTTSLWLVVSTCNIKLSQH